MQVGERGEAINPGAYGVFPVRLNGPQWFMTCEQAPSELLALERVGGQAAAQLYLSSSTLVTFPVVNILRT